MDERGAGAKGSCPQGSKMVYPFYEKCAIIAARNGEWEHFL
jgi:hypothetical protein